MRKAISDSVGKGILSGTSSYYPSTHPTTYLPGLAYWWGYGLACASAEQSRKKLRALPLRRTEDRRRMRREGEKKEEPTAAGDEPLVSKGPDAAGSDQGAGRPTEEWSATPAIPRNSTASAGIPGTGTRNLISSSSTPRRYRNSSGTVGGRATTQRVYGAGPGRRTSIHYPSLCSVARRPSGEPLASAGDTAPGGTAQLLRSRAVPHAG